MHHEDNQLESLNTLAGYPRSKYEFDTKEVHGKKPTPIFLTNALDEKTSQGN